MKCSWHDAVLYIDDNGSTPVERFVGVVKRNHSVNCLYNANFRHGRGVNPRIHLFGSKFHLKCKSITRWKHRSCCLPVRVTQILLLLSLIHHRNTFAFIAHSSLHRKSRIFEFCIEKFCFSVMSKIILLTWFLGQHMSAEYFGENPCPKAPHVHSVRNANIWLTVSLT